MKQSFWKQLCGDTDKHIVEPISGVFLAPAVRHFCRRIFICLLTAPIGAAFSGYIKHNIPMVLMFFWIVLLQKKSRLYRGLVVFNSALELGEKTDIHIIFTLHPFKCKGELFILREVF